MRMKRRFAMLAAACLIPGLASAIPITYEFTGSLAAALPYDGRPVDFARGYITFDTEAAITRQVDTIGDGVGISFGQRDTSYENVITSLWVEYGNGEAHASGSPGYGGIYAALMRDNGPTDYTEWAFQAATTTTTGSTFSLLYDRRCDLYLCPDSTLDSLFAFDDLMHPFGYGIGLFIFAISTGDSRVIYDITSMTKLQVPEPTTSALFLAAIGLFFLLRRRPTSIQP